MSAFETLSKIANCKNLVKADLRFCLVDSAKIPYKTNGEFAHTNNLDDFVSLDEVQKCPKLQNYQGVGCSIQASQICAIDVDHCFETPFDLSSGDDRAIDIIDRFKNEGYVEFSFSGTGLRILLANYLVDNSGFYTKNSKKKIEFYQPSGSFRYVTVTGQTIHDNQIHVTKTGYETVVKFLNDYMKKPPQQVNTDNCTVIEERSAEQVLACVKRLYYKNPTFQDLWFSKAPGSGKDESERDFKLVSMLYEFITKEKTMLKLMFEVSPYFQSKDRYHMAKWSRNNFWYFNYMFDNIKNGVM